ncbi:hypothetical protein KY284_013026 [Solanum tuberosum]|nr:hypothetical protein KY284_013026 [Solanum tuberosum]
MYIWWDLEGGGGQGFKNLYASSFFYDYAAMVGIIDPKKPSGRAKPIQYLYAAKLAFNTKAKDIKSVFPNIDERNIPFICMDLVYEYTLLVDGFGLNMVSEFIARGQCSKWWFGLKKGVNRDQLGSVTTYELKGAGVTLK